MTSSETLQPRSPSTIVGRRPRRSAIRPPASSRRWHRCKAEERNHPPGGDERGPVDVYERDGQERHREGAELIDGTGQHERPHGARPAATFVTGKWHNGRHGGDGT